MIILGLWCVKATLNRINILARPPHLDKLLGHACKSPFFPPCMIMNITKSFCKIRVTLSFSNIFSWMFHYQQKFNRACYIFSFQASHLSCYLPSQLLQTMPQAPDWAPPLLQASLYILTFNLPLSLADLFSEIWFSLLTYSAKTAA